ncbi:helix-turn-helix transcriptional regulator (plasmid) [Pseudomonas luteola]|uniref:helix-turn-helix domain-containing protein n=1 Tax=Pseudomonas luteola TaxID=47886 RepID=UPI003DA1083B
MELKQALGLALKELRNRKKLTQEDFSEVSSRTYLSTLERGLKSPTLEKIEELAGVLQVHPLSLLTLCYQYRNQEQSVEALFDQIRSELNP